MKIATDEFVSESIRYMLETPCAHRKKYGQYFTPKHVRDRLFSLLPAMSRRAPLRILDPACGSGEFLISAHERYPNATLHGFDIDPKLTAITKNALPNAHVRTCDALTADDQNAYDIVIGNPPYFEFKPPSAMRAAYGDVIKGRVNIFTLFVKQGLRMVKEGGYLAYVLPPSMNNGAYFARLRAYIVANADITALTVLTADELFYQAQQTVMLLVLQKGRNTGAHVFTKNGITLFAEDTRALERAYEGTCSLADAGYRVTTGSVVWNQHKEKLTNDTTACPLIWAYNITGKTLTLPQAKRSKPQYITGFTPETGPAIVVNRIVGQVGGGRINAALVPKGMRFLAENHVNVIRFDEKSGTPKLPYREVHRVLTQPETLAVMRGITGNTQISKKELELLLPIGHI